MAVPIRFPAEHEIPDDVRVDAAAFEMRYLVDGEVRKWSGPGMDVHSAVCIDQRGKPVRAVLGRVPELTPKESNEALDAATRAWDHGRGEWPTQTVARRLSALEGFVGRLVAVRGEVVKLLMWEIAKSRADAEKEFDRTVLYIRDTLNAVKHLDRSSSRFEIEEGVFGQIRRSPLGVVLCMGPFNYPLNETYTTLIPALVMGNTTVVKLPRFGQLLHLPTYRAFAESFPKGVVNFVSGEGATVVGPLITSGRIDVLAFIGSQRVADLLKKQHPAPHRLRSVLGLGAKNPGIVLADADLVVSVREAIAGSLSYNGQRCTALKVFYVERKIADTFAEAVAMEVSKLKAGMPWDDGVQLTPLPEDGKNEWLASFVDDAVSKGAKVLNPGGGESLGTYFHPAVLYPVTAAMKIHDEEQFGPIVPIVPFDDERTVVDAITRSPYGQQAAIFGKDPARVGRLIDALVAQVSRINLNSQCQRGPDAFPFTGRKASAEGTLSVTDALRVFSIRTLVAARDDGANRDLVSSILRERRSSFLSTDFLF
jgi:glyceraldehyde-3-phosphate dehydrogenase (NADP+)